MNSRKTLKVGIIGAGDGGILNFKAFLELGAEVVAVCDTNSDQFPRMAGRLAGTVPCHYYAGVNYSTAGVGFHEDAREMLNNQEEINLVVVATPDHQHLEATKFALERNKIVFLEKPVATSTKELLEFQDLALAFPRKIIFSENHSFARPIEAALREKNKLGQFITGNTWYMEGECDRLMGGGKWRTEHAYNPCAGAMSHHFMVARILVDSPIYRVRSDGEVITYKELEKHGGFDTMRGTLEFENGRRLDWIVCLATRGKSSLFDHRVIAHAFQFENGILQYGFKPSDDVFVVNGKPVFFEPEEKTAREQYGAYFVELYKKMHEDTFSAIVGKPTRHTIEHGLNVATACTISFTSACEGGGWRNIPKCLVL